MDTKINCVLWLIFGFHMFTTTSSLQLDHNDKSVDQQSQGLHVNENEILHAIGKLRQDIFNIREEMVGKIDTIEAKMGSTKAKIGSIEAKIDSLESKIVETCTKTNGTEEKMGRIESILLSWEEKLERNMGNLEKYHPHIIDDKLGKLESEVGNIKTKEDAIEMGVKDIKSAIGVLYTNVLSLIPQITAIKSETWSIRTTLTALTSLPIALEKQLQNFRPPGPPSNVSFNPTNPFPLLLQTIARKMLFPVVTSPKEMGSCYEISQLLDTTQNGVYEIYPYKDKETNTRKSIYAYCDMKSEGGGWTVFQRRGIPGDLTEAYRSQLFNKPWNDYKIGFGDPTYDYWLGLESLHQLTKECNHELLITVTHINGTHYQAQYAKFRVSSEAENYKLEVDGYIKGNSTLPDKLRDHSGSKFSTVDRDNDASIGSCSVYFMANGFWFKNCFEVSLNGLYPSSRQPETMEEDSPLGIIWFFSEARQKLRRTEMKIRTSC